jgi:hypothetical protein
MAVLKADKMVVQRGVQLAELMAALKVARTVAKSALCLVDLMAETSAA